jgi:ATP-dependent Clp protease ATP-binding subunit ClpC
VEKTQEDSEEDLKLSVVMPAKKPAPVGVGGGKEDEPAESVDDGGALDQPAVEPPAADE